MTVIIQAMQAKVTPEEVKSKLTPEQLKKAKGKVLVPYTVAEEGKSNPAVEGQHQVLTWPRAVIEKVKNKIKSGTKLFHRHGKTNSHAGRKPVGEILTTYTKEIGGKLRAISIACMDAAEAAIFDICSIEAAVYMDDGIVGDVENITALAVDNSKNDKPAFANAKRMNSRRATSGLFISFKFVVVFTNPITKNSTNNAYPIACRPPLIDTITGHILPPLNAWGEVDSNVHISFKYLFQVSRADWMFSIIPIKSPP